MTKVQLAINIAQLLISVLGFVGIGFLPQYFYQKKINKLKLEIDRLNVSIEKNHPIKVEKYSEFLEKFYEGLHERDPIEQQKILLDALRNVSNAVFLFGSDETISAFLVLRENPELISEEQKLKNMIDTAKFIVQLRKDLNGGKSKITAEDYLKLLLNDYEDNKEMLSKYL